MMINMYLLIFRKCLRLQKNNILKCSSKAPANYRKCLQFQKNNLSNLRCSRSNTTILESPIKAQILFSLTKLYIILSRCTDIILNVLTNMINFLNVTNHLVSSTGFFHVQIQTDWFNCPLLTVKIARMRTLSIGVPLTTNQQLKMQKTLIR
jgi:hypothetical protein